MSEHFFVTGAQRSGTTYLYRILDEHPDIEMAKPVKPEPKFFHWDHLFDRGLDYYCQKFFSSQPNVRLRGEKSTTYIESEKAARRIAGCFPQAKIIFILRDPIERAISNYWFTVNNGLETLPMADAFYHEDERWQNYDSTKISISPYAYLRRGRYIDYLLIYERYFPIDNIKVLLYEQLVGSETHIRDLYAFLGVADYIPSVLHTRVNRGDKPDTTLGPELERYLIDYFAQPNALLAEHLDLSLVEWQR